MPTERVKFQTPGGTLFQFINLKNDIEYKERVTVYFLFHYELFGGNVFRNKIY